MRSLPSLYVALSVRCASHRYEQHGTDSLGRQGVRLPWRQLCTLLKDRNILSLVDGAHELGQQPVDLGSADCDFYVSVSLSAVVSARTS